jgi:hypothetical protein
MVTLISTLASVIAIVGALAKWGRQGWRAIRRRFNRHELDHRPIDGGPWPVHFPPDVEGDRVRLLALVAPSDTLPTTKFDPAKALSFAQGNLAFRGVPAYLGLKEGVRLARSEDDPGFEFAWVCANGRLDLSLYLPITDVDGRRQLDVMLLLKHLRVLATAVQSPDYAAMYGLARHDVPRLFDWRIGVSMYSRNNDGGRQSSWDELGFPGRQPERLIQRANPFCPSTGYARDALWAWPSRQPISELLRAFLQSFLAENGYSAYDEAIADALAELDNS